MKDYVPPDGEEAGVIFDAMVIFGWKVHATDTEGRPRIWKITIEGENPFDDAVHQQTVVNHWRKHKQVPEPIPF